MKEKIINPNISVDPDTLLDEMLFCATRYCIGRRTYALSARIFWDIIKKNRDKFDERRLEFFARDILAEVSGGLEYYRNIELEQASNRTIRNDAYTLLAGYLEAHPGTDLLTTKFTINCLRGKVSAGPLDDTSVGVSFTLYDFDRPSWIRLAKLILGASHRVTFTHPEMGEHTAECIQVPGWDHAGEWRIQYVPTEGGWYCIVPSEWITKIEEI